jgi:hypothetical protein
VLGGAWALSAAMTKTLAIVEAALGTINVEAGAIDNRHRLAEIQVAMLSSARLDNAVRAHAPSCTDTHTDTQVAFP